VAGQDAPQPVGSGIAKEGAVHAITSEQSNQLAPSVDLVPPLHVVTQVAETPSPAVRAGGATRPGADDAATRAVVVGPDYRSLEVHYEFDRVANRWVANLLDAESGEIVRTVPATRVLHQLAEMQHPHVDARA
jgi:hypothetical protein